MDRRLFLALVFAPALAALLDACGSDEDTPGATTGTTMPPSSADETGEARSQLARVSAAPTRAPAAADAFNAFGADLYRRLAADQPAGNLVFSPASIAIALTMTSAGARGQTLTEILAALQIGDPDGIGRATNALLGELESRNAATVTLSIANSLWGQLGLGFEQPFLDALASEYGAGVNLVDYRKDPDSARLAINQWVDDETRGRIPELLAKGVIGTDTRFALVNAIYMKAPWLRPFDVEATSDITFTTAAGVSTTVPAMFTARSLLYSTGFGWQAVELPYEGEQLAMTIVVPDAGALADAEQTLLLTAAIDSFAQRPVHLTLPKFDIESSLSLGDALQQLGIELAFTADADFTGITNDEPLDIAAVVHQASITVDEHGTEAAAATAVIGEATSAPADEPIELVVDRPFLFAVRDRPTGAILFLGRVGDPAA